MCKMDKKREDDIDNVNESDDDYDESGEEEEEDEDVGKVIDVAFDARPPCDSDFHGIKRLLQQLFVKDINDELSELTTLIINQDFMGSVLKQDFGEDSDEDEESDEDDRDGVFAVSTVVNLSENQSLSCIERIRDLLSSKCTESFKEDPSRMAKLLGDASSQVGLLVTERFINIPAQVAAPSMESLKADIDKAVRKKRKFEFSHLILISKSYAARGQRDTVFYSNPEDELYTEMCDWSYTFSIANQRDGVNTGPEWDDDDGDMEALRTVMVFDASILAHLVDKLKAEIPAK